jgi:hypothetical protein
MDYWKVYVTLRDDPKWLRLSDKAKIAWVEVGCWSAHHETDGQLSPGLIPAKLLTELVVAGFIDECREGHVLHNWLPRQRSHAELENDRRKARELRANVGRTSPDGSGERRPTGAERSLTEVEVEVERSSKANTAAPNPGAVSEDWIYLLDQLLRKDWFGLSFAVLKKLERTYGHAIVDQALREVHGYTESPPLRAYPYLESVCVRIQAERGAA